MRKIPEVELRARTVEDAVEKPFSLEGNVFPNCKMGFRLDIVESLRGWRAERTAPSNNELRPGVRPMKPPGAKTTRNQVCHR